MKVEEEKQDFKGGTIVSGIIDLVFLEDGGWVIVDYKTDTVENKEGLANLVEYYRAQVEMYRRFWEEIAQRKGLRSRSLLHPCRQVGCSFLNQHYCPLNEMT